MVCKYHHLEEEQICVLVLEIIFVITLNVCLSKFANKKATFFKYIHFVLGGWLLLFFWREGVGGNSSTIDIPMFCSI